MYLLFLYFIYSGPQVLSTLKPVKLTRCYFVAKKPWSWRTNVPKHAFDSMYRNSESSYQCG